MKKPTPLPGKYRRLIEAFKKRFRQLYDQDGHYVFACHAAFPVAFTPHFLYQLWGNFQTYPDRDAQENLYRIDPIAVSDLLLSNLCKEVGSELFQMHDPVREHLLYDLHQRFDEPRIRMLAAFLYQYADHTFSDPAEEDIRETHQWTALATLDPQMLTEKVGRALSRAVSNAHTGEWRRLNSLIKSFRQQDTDGALDNLAQVAEGLEQHLHGNEQFVVNLTDRLEGYELLRIAIPDIKVERQVETAYFTVEGRFPITYHSESSSWRIDLGMVHGLPDAAFLYFEIDVYASKTSREKIAEARTTEIRTDYSDLIFADDFEPDRQQVYSGRIRSSSIPLMEVWLETPEPAIRERIEEQFKAFRSPFLLLTPRPRPSIRYQLEIGEDQCRILRHPSGQLVHAVEGTAEEDINYILTRLEHIARWERILQLQNPNAPAELSDLSVQIEQGDPEYRLFESNNIRLDYRHLNGAWRNNLVRFVTSLDAERLHSLRICLFYLSSNYGIQDFTSEYISVGERTMPKDSSDQVLFVITRFIEVWLAEKEDEVFDYFKIVFATEHFDPSRFPQEEIDVGGTLIKGITRGATRGVGFERQMPAEWQAYTFRIHSVRQPADDRPALEIPIPESEGVQGNTPERIERATGLLRIPGEPERFATAFLISYEGHLLASLMGLENAEAAFFSLPGRSGSEFKAEILRIDPHSSLALLQIRGAPIDAIVFFGGYGALTPESGTKIRRLAITPEKKLHWHEGVLAQNWEGDAIWPTYYTSLPSLPGSLGAPVIDAEDSQLLGFSLGFDPDAKKNYILDLAAAFELVTPVPFSDVIIRPEQHVQSPFDLQKMVDGAPAGATIVLETGSYELKRPLIIRSKRNLRIRGKGEVIVSAANIGEPVFLLERSTNIDIEGLLLRYAGQESESAILLADRTKAHISDCELTGGAFGVRLAESNVTLHNCSLIANHRVAVLRDEASTLVMTGNRLYDNGNDNAIEVRPAGHIRGDVQMEGLKMEGNVWTMSREREIAILERRVGELRREIEEIEKELAALNPSINTKQVLQYQDLEKKLQRDLEEVLDRLKQLQNQTYDWREEESLRDEANALEEEIYDLKKRINTLDPVKDRELISSLSKRLNQRQKDLNETVQQFEDLRKNWESQLEGENKNKATERIEPQEQKTVEGTVDRITTQIREQIKTLEIEKERLGNQMEGLRKALENKNNPRISHEAIGKDLQDTESEYRQVEAQIAELKEELKNLPEMFKQLEKREVDIRTEIRELEEEMERLDPESNQRGIRRYRRFITELEGELEEVLEKKGALGRKFQLIRKVDTEKEDTRRRELNSKLAICIFDERIAARIEGERRNLLAKQFNCEIYNESIESWEAVKANGFSSYQYTVLHLAFMESMRNKEGKRYGDDGIIDFIQEQIDDQLSEECKLVITSARGRADWFVKLHKSEHSAFIHWCPIEYLITAVDSSLLIDNNIQLKENLVQVLSEAPSAYDDDALPKSSTKSGKRTILFLSADPNRSLHVDKEFKRIQSELEISRQMHDYQLTVVPSVNTLDFMKALYDYQPEIVHFSGHAESGGIIVENDEGKSVILPISVLVRLFKSFKNIVQCIILNASETSQSAKTISEQGIHAIGMDGEISDQAAIEFASGFFSAIAAGSDYLFAFNRGKANIALAGLEGEEVPMLWYRGSRKLEESDSATSPPPPPPIDADWFAPQMKRLQSQLDMEIPRRTIDETLLLATWNLREFDSPAHGRRLEESIAFIAEIIARFDLVVLQEVNGSNPEGLERLMARLGNRWQYFLTPDLEGPKGNSETTAFVYDSRKIARSGPAGDLPVPGQYAPEEWVSLLNRAPNAYGFSVNRIPFVFSLVHLAYGSRKQEGFRSKETQQLIRSIVSSIEQRYTEADNILLLGDFGIVQPSRPVSAALSESGFVIPRELESLPSNISMNRFYDQIAYRPGRGRFQFRYAGIFQFYNSVFTGADEQLFVPHMGDRYHQTYTGEARSEDSRSRYYRAFWRTHQMSDHLPMWAGFHLQ